MALLFFLLKKASSCRKCSKINLTMNMDVTSSTMIEVKLKQIKMLQWNYITTSARTTEIVHNSVTQNLFKIYLQQIPTTRKAHARDAGQISAWYVHRHGRGAVYHISSLIVSLNEIRKTKKMHLIIFFLRIFD